MASVICLATHCNKSLFAAAVVVTISHQFRIKNVKPILLFSSLDECTVKHFVVCFVEFYYFEAHCDKTSTTV